MRVSLHCIQQHTARTFLYSTDAGTYLKGCELMEVGREERGAADLCHEVLRDGPRQAKAIIGAGAAPQLIYDDQGLAARTLQSNRPW